MFSFYAQFLFLCTLFGHSSPSVMPWRKQTSPVPLASVDTIFYEEEVVQRLFWCVYARPPVTIVIKAYFLVALAFSCPWSL